MNPLILAQIKLMLQSKKVIVIPDTVDSWQEHYLVKDSSGVTVLEYTHINTDNNIFDLYVFGKHIVHLKNPAKGTSETNAISEIANLIKHKYKLQNNVQTLTADEQFVLQQLQTFNSKEK